MQRLPEVFPPFANGRSNVEERAKEKGARMRDWEKTRKLNDAHPQKLNALQGQQAKLIFPVYIIEELLD